MLHDIVENQELLDWIKDLWKKNLTGASVVMSWIVRRIQTLQQRSHFGFRYRGIEDPSRFSSERISGSKAMHRVRRVLDVVYGVPVVPTSYTINNLPKEVCKTF